MPPLLPPPTPAATGSGRPPLAIVARARAEEAGWRMVLCAAIGGAAALIYADWRALLWALAAALVMFADRRVHDLVVRQLPHRAPAWLLAWTFFVSSVLGVFAPLLWLSEPRHGDALAYLFLCVSAFSAAVTLHRARDLLIAALAPLMIVFIGICVFEFSDGVGRRALADLSPILALCVTLFVGARILARVGQVDVAEAQAAAEAARADALARELADARAYFSGRLAAETRAPSAAVESAALSLESVAMPTHVRASLQTLLEAVWHHKAIAAECADPNHVEHNRFEIAPLACDPRALVRSTAMAFAGAAERRGLTLLIDIPENAPASVLIDPLRVRQIVTELVDNAVRHTSSGGVRVRLHWGPGAHAGYVRLGVAVSDTGPGMTRAELSAHMHERRGAGRARFGLAGCARLARLMGARLAARSASGHGATLSLAMDAPLAQLPTLPAAGPRLLVIAPGPTQTEIAALLASLDPRLAFIEPGAPARAALMNAPYDLIIADCGAADFDAVDVVEALRDGGVNSGAPVLALVGAGELGMAELCRECGVDGIVLYPLASDLRAEVQRVLGGAAHVAVA